MSTEPQAIERFLNVPDVVGAVFEQLDPASRRAFFQSHPHVAHAGPVLAQSELRIELSPSDLEEQWQRVLRLTRSQPPRCLVLSAPSKDLLLNLMAWAPQGMQEQKQRVLQGTKLQLQVLTKLDTGGMSRLQSHLNSLRKEWEQVPKVEGAVVQRVLDLCGRKLTGTIEGDLEPPNCTLRNGTLQLRGASCVRVAAKGVQMEGLTIKGGERDAAVDMMDGSSLKLEGCRMEGGRGINQRGGAVRVVGNSSVSAQQTTFHSSGGCGLVVRGSKAVLEKCTLSENGFYGVCVYQGSTLHATKCQVDNNESTNICVEGGASFASLDHCTSNGSKGGNGWRVEDQTSSLTATDSQACSNYSNGALALSGASLTLVRCQNDHNRVGWNAYGSGSTLVAEDSSTRTNEKGNAIEVDSGRITLHGLFCDLGGQEVQQP